MSLIKLSANKIFTGKEMLHDAVLIMDGRGKVIEVINQSEAGDEIQKHSGILSPGFINVHCHLELSHLKGHIPEKTGMVNFLLQVLRNRNNLHSGDLIVEAAEEEMIRGGIVAVGDISNTVHTINQKRKSNLYYHTFIEAAGFIPATAMQRFEQAETVWKEFATYFDKGSLSIVPHAPYSVSEKLFELISGFGKQTGCIHNQESVEENEFFMNGSGEFNRLYKEIGMDISFFIPPEISSLKYFLKYLADYNRLILVHNIATAVEDLEYAFTRTNSDRIFWCLCPNANLYISGKLPDIPMIRKFTNQFVMGTDSLASNHQLSIIAELNTIQEHFPFFALIDLLRWATLNGAQALGISDMFGSFEKGKKPGVILIKNVAEDSLKDAVCKRLL